MAQEKFKSAVPSYDKTPDNKQVKDVLRYGDPVFVFSQYVCLNCEKDSRIVSHTCKSKFCLRCRRVDGENFAPSIAAKLYEDEDYRNVVLKIPAKLRTIFYKNRFTGDLYSAF